MELDKKFIKIKLSYLKHKLPNQSLSFVYFWPHPEKLAVDHKKILIDGDLDFLKETPFWNQEMKKIKFPMDVQKSYELSKLIP